MYCHMEWILHNFPATDTYAKLFNPQAEAFGRWMNQAARSQAVSA